MAGFWLSGRELVAWPGAGGRPAARTATLIDKIIIFFSYEILVGSRPKLCLAACFLMLPLRPFERDWFRLVSARLPPWFGCVVCARPLDSGDTGCIGVLVFGLVVFAAAALFFVGWLAAGQPGDKQVISLFRDRCLVWLFD